MIKRLTIGTPQADLMVTRPKGKLLRFCNCCRIAPVDIHLGLLMMHIDFYLTVVGGYVVRRVRIRISVVGNKRIKSLHNDYPPPLSQARRGSCAKDKSANQQNRKYASYCSEHGFSLLIY